MSEDTKLTPKLRFPDFLNFGEWQTKKLGSICDVRDGTHDSPKYVPKGYPLITSKNLLKDGTIDFTNVNYIIESDYIQINKRSKVILGDILFGMIGTIGNPVIVKSEGFAIKNVALIKEGEELNQNFLLQQFKSDFIGLQFQRVNAGGILKFIALGIIRDLKVLVPKLQEQLKIASCLSSLDGVIAINKQKLELLKEHKKGLMQKLFPREGEKVPEYRFPEFVGDGEWEEKTLDKVVNKFIVPMRDKPKKLDGEIPWCRIEDFNGIYLSTSKSNQGVNLQTISEMNLKVYPIDTLLVSCSADLGRCAITKAPLITNQTFIGLVLNSNKVETLFLYYVMINSRNELNARSSGTTISYLSRQQFENFEIILPGIKEQLKIASCISSLDELISSQSIKIQQLKLHKKGLMQGLFPKPQTES